MRRIEEMLAAQPERDAYDHAVAWLREEPQEIFASWMSGGCRPSNTFPARILFGFVTENRAAVGQCGCVTSIRKSAVDRYALLQVAKTTELTAAIQADERVPVSPQEITVDHLELFAEWQRRIDQELHREPPVWLGPDMFAEAVG